ncbi:hypothetical protein ABW21_db0203187 [Orbilia brochopaga]|nr:hypothetical protein ABW21_db0203187 [Drechslerella brochopaga]
MFATFLRRAGPARTRVVSRQRRCIQTLAQNQSIYVHRLPAVGSSIADAQNPTYALSYLPTPPADSPPSAILGHTTEIPPTPSSFTENPEFRPFLLAVLREHAAQDPVICAEAFAAWSASMRRGLHAGAPSSSSSERRGGSAAGTNSTGVGGFHNIVDRRVAGDIGMRGVPEPQDMLGVVGVDGEGSVVGGSDGFVECESYRVVTGDGVGVLTEYLEKKLVERLKQ